MNTETKHTPGVNWTCKCGAHQSDLPEETAEPMCGECGECTSWAEIETAIAKATA